jgi:hypothetical protein
MPMTEINILDYCTLTQAAETLGYRDNSALRHHCLDGRIPGAIKISKLWLIPRSWVLSEQKNPSLAPTGGRGSSRKSS